VSKQRKKRKKPKPQPRTPAESGGGIGFLLGSLTQTSTIGYWLIALGAMAVILSIVIYRTGK